MVFFEAPHRTGEALAAMAEVFGAPRRAVVCRELTKTYEEVRRATLAELVDWAGGGVRGEVTIVVAGATSAAAEALDDAEVAALVDHAEREGLSRRDAVLAVAKDTGLGRRRVYQAAHRR
jgi:16S rRNA (cytidine1402-2'-O)-methyltransferase